MSLLLAAALALPSASAAGPAAPSLSPAGREAVELLKALVRADTSNPPGREAAAAAVLGDYLRKNGVPFEVLESTPGRANLVARLKGNGTKRPLLLLAHLDVVGAEAARWTFPPFAGDSSAGYVRGRGAVDDKSMAAAFAVAMAELARAKAPLARDVVFAATADEESGGAWGVQWLLAKRPDLLDAELALNEGGSTTLVDGALKVFAVQVAEKGYMDAVLVARGAGGHASVPDPENPVLRLARALTALEELRPPPRLSPVTRAYFASLRGIESPELSAAFDDILSEDEERVERGADVLREHPYYGAMAADSWAPTLVSGGVRENVIPSDASVNLNIRLLPGTDPEEFLAALRAQTAEAGVSVERLGPPTQPPPGPMPLDGDFWRAARGAVRGLAPGAEVVPFLSVGSTDAEPLRRRGVLVYGVEFPLAAEDQSRIHGHDERMPESGLDFGVRLIVRLAAELAR